MNLILKVIFSFSLIYSCTKKEVVYQPTQMWLKAKAYDPDIELVPIVHAEKRILCENYGKGCLIGTGKRIKVRKVELITIGFETVEDARREAYRLNQYHFANWLFDDVTGEPVLESWVKDGFGAINPKASGLPKKNGE